MNPKSETKKILINAPLVKTSTAPKQIALPGLSNYGSDSEEGEEDDEEELPKSNLKNLNPPSEPVKTEKKPLSGLLGILPPPKAATNPFEKTVADSNLIPRTVNKKKPTEDDTNQNSKKFKSDYGNPNPFSYIQKSTNIEDDPEPVFPDDDEIPNKKKNYEEISRTIIQYKEEENQEAEDDEEPEASGNNQQSNRAPQEIDAEALAKLVGGSRKMRNEKIEITDVRAKDIVGDNESELVKQITSEYKPPSNKDYFAGSSRKKHQITYLAYVAKERDQELRNTWAQSKFNKQQARQKYGF